MNLLSFLPRLALCALVTGFLAMGEAQAQQTESSPYPVNIGPFAINHPEVKKDYDNTSLRIIGASYGLNCNAKLAADSVAADDMVKQNNAYDKISRACDKLANCYQRVTEESMGYKSSYDTDADNSRPELAKGCAKELVVDYSCSPTDGNHTARMSDGGTLAIECKPDN